MKERPMGTDWFNGSIDDIVHDLKHYSGAEIVILEKECGARYRFDLALLLNAYYRAKFCLG